MCCSSYTSEDSEINGECPDCGEPTVDGVAASGCNYSPIVCKTCNSSPCDLSC